MYSSTAQNLQSLKNDARETTAGANDDLRATANQAGRTVRQFIDNASEELSHATKTVTDHVHEKPVQSSLIALGLGFAIGALLRRI